MTEPCDSQADHAIGQAGEIGIQRDYWNREADAFKRIYSRKKSPLSVWLDKVFRRDMFQRFEFTIDNCQPIAGRTFLDVGCGSGLYVIELARKGAATVVGIDIAGDMLALCRQFAEQENVQDRCTFVASDLLQYSPEEPFDVTIGIGLFDYISDPLPVITKMRQVTTDKVVLSFPRFWTWRAPVRRVRLAIRGCPVYFFTKRRIFALMRQAGFERHTITRVGKLHCVVGHVVQPFQAANA